MFRTSLLFQFHLGDHICVFYRTKEALREVLTPYVAEGLRRGERCFCAQKPWVCKNLIFDLRFLGVDTDDAIRRGALEIHTVDEVYFPRKKFEPAAMMDFLLHSIEEASRQGFTALRTAGELSWASEGRSTCDQLLCYEKLVDELFPGKLVIGLCQYSLDAFPADVLEAVIASHRLHMQESKPSSFHSGLSVRSHNCWTEIVADRLLVDPSYYYVVRRRKPAEILGWGIAPTFEQANELAARIAAQTDC